MPIASLPSRQTDGSGDIAATAWQSLLSAAAARPARAGTDPSSPAAAPADLLGLYRQLAECVATGAYVAAHLGQSLDGHIATENGASRYITGTADRAHNHRMRALFDAVVVGRGTVQHDDPRLTVRSVAGDNPVRVVVDPERSLGADYAIFDSAARTDAAVVRARPPAGRRPPRPCRGRRGYPRRDGRAQPLRHCRMPGRSRPDGAVHRRRWHHGIALPRRRSAGPIASDRGAADPRPWPCRGANPGRLGAGGRHAPASALVSPR